MMDDPITPEVLQKLRDDGRDEVADEIERLQSCSRRLMATVGWMEKNQPDVFTRGLWDAINAA